MSKVLNHLYVVSLLLLKSAKYSSNSYLEHTREVSSSIVQKPINILNIQRYWETLPLIDLYHFCQKKHEQAVLHSA